MDTDHASLSTHEAETAVDRDFPGGLIQPRCALVLSRARIAAVARVRNQTDASFLDELPCLLAERAMTAHALAKKAGINHSHLSRAKRGKDYKSLSGELVARLGGVLGLPAGYFPEEREAVVVDRIRADPALRDDLYRRVTRERPPKAPNGPRA